jgi:hypothetical protein
MFMNDYEANMIYELEYKSRNGNKDRELYQNQRHHAIHLTQLLLYIFGLHK